MSSTTGCSSSTSAADDTWDVVTEKGTVHAEHVINAAGLWAKQVGRMVGLELPLSPLEHHYLVTETIPEVAALDFEVPMMVDLEGFTYMRQDQKGVLVGIYEINHKHWNIDGAPWDYGVELIQENTDRIADELEMAFNRYPVLQEVGVKNWVNGAFTFSPDGNPLVGPVRGPQELLALLRCDGGLPARRRRRQDAGGVDDPRRARGRCLADGHRPLRRLRLQPRVHQADHRAVLLASLCDDLSQRAAAGRAAAEEVPGL